MNKGKQTKAQRKATKVSLPSSTTSCGEEKCSGSMKTTAGTTIITRGSLGPRKETISTPVTSNSTKKSKTKKKKKKKNVVSLEKGGMKTIMELSNDIFRSAWDVRDAIEKEKDELMNSSFENLEKQTRSGERKKNNEKEKKANDNGGVDEVNKPVTANDKTLEDAAYLKEIQK